MAVKTPCSSPEVQRCVLSPSTLCERLWAGAGTPGKFESLDVGAGSQQHLPPFPGPQRRLLLSAADEL